MKKFWLHAACLFAAGVFAIGFAACGEAQHQHIDADEDGICDTCNDPMPGSNDPTDPETSALDGWYVLKQKTVEGFDATSQYVMGALRLNAGKALWYETDYSGQSIREGDVTVTETGVSIAIGLRTYDFALDETAHTLTCSRKENKQSVVWVYERDAAYAYTETEEGVPFESELFGDDITQNFYNYCPTVLMEGNDTMHIWYCSNKTSGNVTDYAAYRKGTLNASGKWVFTEKQLVVAPSETDGDWDDKHICDPSVVKGAFSYKGEEYSYLMAFLGCKYGNKNQTGAIVDVNEVGIAVAKSPEGPWVKWDSNPICNFFASEDYDTTNVTWGYGQPSLINVDGEGKVLMFYTKGTPRGTYTGVEEWDLSDLDAPQKLREARLGEKGVASTNDIHSADLAYDPVRNRIYMLTDVFPMPTDGGVNWISGTVPVYYMKLGENGFDDLFTDNPQYTWTSVGTVDKSISGAARNHNAGLVTDAYGNLINPYEVPVVYTAADLATQHTGWSAGGQWPCLHTYRLHGTTFTVL